MACISLHVEGVVQGVGLRPFVHRTATDLGLAGWVRNGRSGVDIELSGEEAAIRSFCRTLEHDLPPPGRVARITRRDLSGPSLETSGELRILPSEDGVHTQAEPLLPADLAACAECLAETLAPSGRRSGYPFTCCARCGPRFSIIAAMPYDRERTSMAAFTACEACRREYEDPADRRFHAEPIACPRCGPRLSLLSARGEPLATAERALELAAAALREGHIVALRGVGGFQLLVRATDGAAVTTLRRRKQRDDKPFAVLFANLDEARRAAQLSESEARALSGPEAPIVLARLHDRHPLAAEVAPQSPLVGALLPASPLHRLIVDAVGEPLVCTSGNLSGEPLCKDTDEALLRLGGIADLFLTHDRPILRQLDDAVLREGPRGMAVLRRARGQAPQPVARLADQRSILGMGAFLKSTITLAARGTLVTSQHLGDMDDAASIDLLERTTREMTRFFAARPALLACDLHPDFPSTRLAERLATEWNTPLVRVQHHHAHIAAVMAEQAIEDEVLGLAWDGYGFGPDGTAWGGEALLATRAAFRRVAFPSPFRLPGGDRAAREPLRCALGLLHSTLGSEARSVTLPHSDPRLDAAILSALDRQFMAPCTTSIGRLFDAVAALLGLRAVCSFEGQAAMELEWCAAMHRDPAPPPYHIPLDAAPDGALVWNLTPLVRQLIAERDAGRAVAELAARFHASLVEIGVRIAQRVACPRVVLAGGCFQNDLLTRALVLRLEQAGFAVYMPTQVPVNDGGISVGQVAVASAQLPPAARDESED